MRNILDLPPGRFRDQLARLPADARGRALAQLADFHFTPQDLSSLHVDPSGSIFYADTFQLEPVPQAESEPQISEAAVAVNPFPGSLVFHSRPGAQNVLFLNFAGDTISGTAWNTSLGRSSIPAVAFSTDADYATFSDAEQLAIKRIWQRVAEDFAPFNVDVTTERPATFTTRTAHALITRNTDANGQPNPSSGAGGVAYINVFATASHASYRPAWVYYNNLANNESYIAEAASHEIGHNMGLSHDGTSNLDYYGGHGSGNTSWGPIMGTGYGRHVSQWCKGEYYDANNTQDDLSLISAKLSYRVDDHGNTLAAATALVLSGTNVLSTTPENDPWNTNSANKGVLERNTDMDFFSFSSGNGPVKLTVNPWISPSGTTRGGNPDVALELRNAAGALVATNNPAAETFATIQANLAEGVYYLLVRNAGVGNPTNSSPSGYTAYGSIGQYFISGSLIPSSLVIPPGAQLQVADLTQPGSTAHHFTVTYSDNAGISVGTIDSSDIRISGDNGYDRSAVLVSVDLTSDGTPRVATYAAPPPDGVAWREADNAIYSVFMRSNQVSDTESSFVPAGLLGQFNVAIAHSVYYASMDANPGWTLEGHWQHGKPLYAGGVGPASGFTGTNILAYNLSGSYADRLALTFATTPPINCYGASSLTLRFRRWLGLRNGDTAIIQVSTNGTSWTDLWSTTKPVSDSSWQQVQYALPGWAAGSSALRLRWGLASGPSQNSLGWNIDDVELLGDGKVDSTPPEAHLAVANITSAGALSYSFNVTYSDDTAVSVASIGSGDAFVTGPNGYSNLVEFVGIDAPSDGTPRVSTYVIPAPGEAWDVADAGIYTITLRAGEVVDTFENPVDEMVLGSFVVAIATNTQSLVVSPVLLTVPEGGSSSFTVRLATPPLAPVIVYVAPAGGDTDLVLTSGATNVFTALNWSNPVPVTISGLPDVDQENGTATFEVHSEGLAPILLTVAEHDTTPDTLLEVSMNNVEWGTVAPAAGAFPVGTEVRITAVPAAYFYFSGWTGAFVGRENPLSVIMQSNVTLVATFAEMVTTNRSVPLGWLAQHGYTNDLESAVLQIGANGRPVWESYVAGLDPRDSKSQLGVQATLDPVVGDVLAWQTVTGRVYSVLQSTDLKQGFSPIPGAVDLPWTLTRFTNSAPSAPAAPRFYKIEVRLP